VAQLRHDADEDEKAGRADDAKRKRVAGQLPPGFANPSSIDRQQ
jgi:hypothetical protein